MPVIRAALWNTAASAERLQGTLGVMTAAYTEMMEAGHSARHVLRLMSDIIMRKLHERDIHDRISAIRDYYVSAVNKSATEIAALIERVEAITLSPDDFAEWMMDAMVAHSDTHAALNALLRQQQAREDRKADHGITIDTVGKLLIAWQRTREWIGQVEASQPAQMTAAMAELVAARADMDRVVNEIVYRGAA